MTNISLSERQNYIGGSEIAGLFGKSPYTTRYTLFHEKSGTISPQNLDDKERVQAGQFMESAIARWAQQAFDLKLRRVHRYIKHPSVGGFGVSLDYESVWGHTPWEIKNVDGLTFHNDWKNSGDEITHVPLHIRLQCQAQLACTGKSEHGLIVCVGGNRLLKTLLPRHEGTIKIMLDSIMEFWADVQVDNEPEPDFTADAITISRLYSNAGGGDIDMSANNRVTELVAAYDRASIDEKQAKQSKQALKAELLTLIGAADRVTCGDYTLIATPVNRQEYTVKASTYRGFRLTEKPAQNNKSEQLGQIIT